MGLDLTISVQSDFGADEQGRYTYKVTHLAILRNCWVTLNELGNRLDGEFSNCAAHSFYGETFHDILKDMQEELTELSKVKELTDYQKSRMGRLSDEISELEDFIETNNVPNNATQDYQVHAWW